MSAELKLNALYRHYKTKNVYMPVLLLKNTGDGRNDEIMVLYFSFSNREPFTRPLKEFVEELNVGGLLVRRFSLLENGS